MRSILRPRDLSFALVFALVLGGAILSGPTTAFANSMTVGPSHLALPPSITGMSALRSGQNVHLVWTYAGAKVKGFYLFHVAPASVPPADFLVGGWKNDVIVDGALRQANLSVPAAVKPQKNYYLICIAGAGSAYTCSAVFTETPSFNAVQPMLPR